MRAGAFVALDGDVDGELGGRRADRVHEGESHEDVGLDARREVLHVDVAEARENFLLALVARVEETAKGPQFRVGIFGQVGGSESRRRPALARIHRYRIRKRAKGRATRRRTTNTEKHNVQRGGC